MRAVRAGRAAKIPQPGHGAHGERCPVRALVLLARSRQVGVSLPLLRVDAVDVLQVQPAMLLPVEPLLRNLPPLPSSFLGHRLDIVFLAAFLVTYRHRCGRSSCRCHHDGPLHSGQHLTFKEAGKTRSV